MNKNRATFQQLTGAVKRMLPDFMLGPIRSVWRRGYALSLRFPEHWLYLRLWLYRLTGRSYLQWYADTLDRWVESRDPAFLERKRSVLESSGSDDLAVLKSFGMTPVSTLHEFGCGQLRSALHFAEFLDPGHFSANDASKGRIDLGMELFGDRLKPRQPTLIVNPDNSFDWLGGRTFDYIWCHAVFGHMPPDDVEDTIRNVRKAMHAGSMFLFTHDGPRLQMAAAKDEIIRVDSRNWLQSLSFFRRIGSKYGLATEDASQAIRPYSSYRGHMCLAKMTLLPRAC
jgi:SAM-dependent methyltransferase